MPHQILAIAGSPRRQGNSETMLDRALAGVTEADPEATVTKLILNDLNIRPCQHCWFCVRKGYCRFAKDDDMKHIYPALDECDRFIIVSPIFFANVSAQLKGMIDRCQAIWSRKFELHQSHENPDRKALFLCCGGFNRNTFFKCARQVVAAWCVVLDIKLIGERFYQGIDAKGDIEKHPTALDDVFELGKRLMTDPTPNHETH